MKKLRVAANSGSVDALGAHTFPVVALYVEGIAAEVAQRTLEQFGFSVCRSRGKLSHLVHARVFTAATLQADVVGLLACALALHESSKAKLRLEVLKPAGSRIQDLTPKQQIVSVETVMDAFWEVPVQARSRLVINPPAQLAASQAGFPIEVTEKYVAMGTEAIRSCLNVWKKLDGGTRRRAG